MKIYQASMQTNKILRLADGVVTSTMVKFEDGNERDRWTFGASGQGLVVGHFDNYQEAKQWLVERWQEYIEGLKQQVFWAILRQEDARAQVDKATRS